MKRKIICMGLIAAMAMSGMTGCGRESFNVTESIEVNFSGYNGYGVCSIDNEYAWVQNVIDWYGDSVTEMQQIGMEVQLEDTVTYEIDKKDGLSNGDTVTISAKIGSAAEEYAFDLVGTDITVTVAGLEEVEEFDPFDGVKVTYDGFAPNGTAKISGGDSSISYSLDKNEGLSNGDTLTVSASANCDADEYARNYGKVLSETEKTFTVEGLASYAMSVEDIPQATLDKMQAQALDSINAYGASWESDSHDDTKEMGEPELLGYYFLSGKEGFSVSPYNEIYLVYKITNTMNALKRGGDGQTKEQGQETYYAYYRYSDIILLADNTCSVDFSKGEMNEYQTKSDYGYEFFGATFYWFKGYPDLDSMFNECVTQKISNYNYESTVQ